VEIVLTDRFVTIKQLVDEHCPVSEDLVRLNAMKPRNLLILLFVFVFLLCWTLNNTPTLAFSPLCHEAKVPVDDERYRSYKTALLERHLFDGLVVNVCLDAPQGNVIKRHFGDSTLWTGVLLGTLALEYSRTKASGTLEQIREIVDALSRLQVAPGYLVRTDRGEEAGTELAEPGAGQYMGVLFGYDLAFRYADDDEIRRRIREDVDRMGTYLQDNWYIFFKPTGGLVKRGANGVFFEYVWGKIFQRITGNSKKGKSMQWWEFTSRLRGQGMKLDAWIGLMERPISPRKRYTMFLRNIVGLYRLGIVRYFNIHLAFLSAYSALAGDEEADPEVSAAFRELYLNVQSIPGDENALFAAMAKTLIGADDSKTQSALDRLKLFPEGLPNSWDKAPFHQDNAWQRSPANRPKVYGVFNQDAPCEYVEYPGLDYLLPCALCTG